MFVFVDLYRTIRMQFAGISTDCL